MDGILLINKPKHWSSFDVVAKVRGVLNADFKASGSPIKAKVGHTGTLDPLATGLLILTVGSYCKRAQEFSKMDKTYEVEIMLGLTSTTDDEEGDKHKISTREPSHAEVIRTTESFVGDISQVPPVYSAIKVNGRRAYELARAGKAVTLEARTVTIHSINNIRYNYPLLTFTAHVSSGTYIRTLARDIGESLKTGAYMSQLCRTAIGPYRLPAEPLHLEAISAEDIKRNLQTVA